MPTRHSSPRSRPSPRAPLAIFGILVLALALVPGCNPSAPPTTTPPAKSASQPSAATAGSIVTGDLTAAGNSTIAPGGGAVSVSKAGDPLDGLTITVPNGAYSGNVSFSISERPVKSTTFGTDVSVVAPLITVDNGSAPSAQPMTVKIPIKLPEGHVPMAFYYDARTGLEAMPLVAYDDKSVTTVTRHFTDIVVLSKLKDKIWNIGVDTGFKLGVDDWNLKNAGSYLSPQGYCEGMCLTAMWYFENEKSRSGAPLFSQNPISASPQSRTPHFWQDDADAIRLASVVQTTTKSNRGELYDVVAKIFEDEAARANEKVSRARVQFYAFALALDITERPQLMIVMNTKDKSTHALICYAIKGQTLYVEDPNIAGSAGILGNEIKYDDTGSGSFLGYTSAENFTDLLARRYKSYDGVYFYGTTSLVETQKIERAWSEFRAGTVGQGQFPSYAVTLLELNEKGDVTDQYELNRLAGATTSSRWVGFDLRAPFESSLELYSLEDVLAFEQSYSVDGPRSPKQLNPLGVPMAELKQGENWIGLYVQGKIGPSWGWAGFDWVNVRYQPKQTPSSTPAKATTPPTSTPASTARPSATSVGSSQASYGAQDCQCPGVVLGGYETIDNTASNGGALSCQYRWEANGSKLNNVKLYATRPMAPAELTKQFQFLRGTDANSRTSPACGKFHKVLEDTPTRYTTVTAPNPGAGNMMECCVTSGCSVWYGFRTSVYRGVAIWMYYAQWIPGSQDAVVSAMDAAEGCAKQAIDRYLAR